MQKNIGGTKLLRLSFYLYQASVFVEILKFNFLKDPALSAVKAELYPPCCDPNKESGLEAYRQYNKPWE